MTLPRLRNGLSTGWWFVAEKKPEIPDAFGSSGAKQTVAASGRITHKEVLQRSNFGSSRYLCSVWTLWTRCGKPRFWIPLEAEILGDHGKVRTGEAKHECRPLPLVHDVWVDGFRLKNGLAVRI